VSSTNHGVGIATYVPHALQKSGRRLPPTWQRRLEKHRQAERRLVRMTQVRGILGNSRYSAVKKMIPDRRTRMRARERERERVRTIPIGRLGSARGELPTSSSCLCKRTCRCTAKAAFRSRIEYSWVEFARGHALHLATPERAPYLWSASREESAPETSISEPISNYHSLHFA